MSRIQDGALANTRINTSDDQTKFDNPFLSPNCTDAVIEQQKSS
jgi:hypothetical protein